MALSKGAAGAIGLQAGGPVGGAAAIAVPQAMANFRNGLAAKAATRGITGPAPSISGAVGIGGGLGGVGSERAVNGLQTP